MPSFKQYLQEAGTRPDFAPWHLTDPEEVKAYIEKSPNGGAGGYRVNKDGTVTLLGGGFRPLGVTEKIEGGSATHFKVKFKTAPDFRIQNSLTLTSLWGNPDKCKSYHLEATGITSLTHLTPNISEYLFLQTPNLKEFDCKVTLRHLIINDIGHVDIKTIGDSFKIKNRLTITCKKGDNSFYRVPILWLMKLRCDINISNNTTHDAREEISAVCAILNRNKGDILQAQEELIEAGYKEYARF